jgi:hypothetical protein
VTGHALTALSHVGAPEERFDDQGIQLASFNCYQRDLFIGDFDHDKRSDVLCHNGSTDKYGGTGWVMLTTLTGLGTSSVWLSDWGAFNGNLRGIADFDGDGRDDVWSHGTADSMFAGTTRIALSTGSSVTGFDTTSHSDPVLTGFCDWLGAEFGSGDFNHDGRPDFYCHGAKRSGSLAHVGEMWVVLGTGEATFAAPVKVRTDLCTANGATLGVGDFDGDGATDFFCHHSAGTNFAYSRWDASKSTMTIVDGASTLIGCTAPGSQFGTMN